MIAVILGFAATAQNEAAWRALATRGRVVFLTMLHDRACAREPLREYALHMESFDDTWRTRETRSGAIWCVYPDSMMVSLSKGGEREATLLVGEGKFEWFDFERRQVYTARRHSRWDEVPDGEAIELTLNDEILRFAVVGGSFPCLPRNATVTLDGWDTLTIGTRDAKVRIRFDDSTYLARSMVIEPSHGEHRSIWFDVRPKADRVFASHRQLRATLPRDWPEVKLAEFVAAWRQLFGTR